MAEFKFTADQPLFKRPDLLQHGNIPKPLHTVAPRNILGQEWWNHQRRRAYRVNNHCCWACGVHKSQAAFHQWLEAHEIYDTNWKQGRAVYLGCCALCHSCHGYIHSGRLRMLRDERKITKSKYRQIRQHGKRVLGPDAYHVPNIKEIQQDWSRWHLVLKGRKYYSPFKDLQDWRNHFGN